MDELTEAEVNELRGLLGWWARATGRRSDGIQIHVGGLPRFAISLRHGNLCVLDCWRFDSGGGYKAVAENYADVATAQAECDRRNKEK